VVAVTTGAPDSTSLALAAALQGCELIVLGPAIRDEVLEQLQPKTVQVIAREDRRGAALEATARRLAARSLGLVLSGGGARAFAELGVFEELGAAGLRFDRIAGVSLGALVGAVAAMGLSGDEMFEAAKRHFVDTNPSRDFVPPAYSILRGGRTRRGLYEYFGERRIEELPLRFFCLSCDLIAREVVEHRTGRLVDAVYPSLAIPAVFPPVATTDGRLLVDGGVLDNLPVATMACRGEGPVIAVDVTGRNERSRRGGAPLMARIGRPLRRALTGSDAEIPRLAETIVRTMLVGSSDVVAAARLHADLVVTPRVEGIALMDWKALPRVRELGRQAARDALAANPEVIARLGI
jgi:predicted acylesterase/phospholipase RssA